MTLLEYEEAIKETDVSVFVRENFGIDLPSIYRAEFEYMQTRLNETLLHAHQMSFPSQAADFLVVSPKVLKQIEDMFRNRENK